MIVDGVEYIAIAVAGGCCDGCAGLKSKRLCVNLEKAAGGCDGVIFKRCGRYDGVNGDQVDYEQFLKLRDYRMRCRKAQGWGYYAGE